MTAGVIREAIEEDVARLTIAVPEKTLEKVERVEREDIMGEEQRVWLRMAREARRENSPRVNLERRE